MAIVFAVAMTAACLFGSVFSVSAVRSAPEKQLCYLPAALLSLICMTAAGAYVFGKKLKAN